MLTIAPDSAHSIGSIMLPVACIVRSALMAVNTNTDPIVTILQYEAAGTVRRGSSLNAWTKMSEKNRPNRANATQLHTARNKPCVAV